MIKYDELRRFSGTESQVREIQLRFLPYFRQCSSVVDLGCGRGEFLEVLQREGIQCTGVDADESGVRHCQQKGLQAIYGDVLGFLNGKLDEYDGIFCSHLVEHLDYSAATSLLQSCHGALRPGGVMVIVTPNSNDLWVLGELFWLDPTHIRLYPLKLLEVMCRSAGFEISDRGTFLGGIKVIGRRNLPRLLMLKLLLGSHFGAPNAYLAAKRPRSEL